MISRVDGSALKIAKIVQIAVTAINERENWHF